MVNSPLIRPYFGGGGSIGGGTLDPHDIVMVIRVHMGSLYKHEQIHPLLQGFGNPQIRVYLVKKLLLIFINFTQPATVAIKKWYTMFRRCVYIYVLYDLY